MPLSKMNYSKIYYFIHIFVFLVLALEQVKLQVTFMSEAFLADSFKYTGFLTAKLT